MRDGEEGVDSGRGHASRSMILVEIQTVQKDTKKVTLDAGFRASVQNSTSTKRLMGR